MTAWHWVKNTKGEYVVEALGVKPTTILTKAKKPCIILEEALSVDKPVPPDMITEMQLIKEQAPIPYTKVKRLARGLLYVMKVVRPDPIIGYGKSYDEYSVIDLRGWRKGYEPRLDIVGEYTPNPNDLFRMGTGRLPPYQPVTTGDKLQAEMERLNVYTAWRIGKY